jgi:PAS domain S-box-containing protein
MNKKKILVVEDEGIVAQDIQQTLRAMGYEVPAVAFSGTEALAYAEELKPDLVLMDVVLKGDMDGIEAAGRIRDAFNIPIVYLTAYADDETLGRARVTEPFGYILKPFEERELHTAIEMALYKHRLERELKKSEERLALALDVASDGLWDWNVTTGETYFSPRYYTMLGYAPGEFEASYEAWHRMLHPDDRNRTVEVIRKALESGAETYEVEFRIRGKNGDYRWIRLRGKVAERDAAGTVVRMVGTHLNVTDKKKAEETVRKSEREKSLILENTDELVLFKKTDHRIIWGNRAAAVSVGLSPGELVGKTCHELWNGSESPCPECPLRDIAATGTGAEGEMTTPDGRFWLLRGTPVFDANGRVSGVVQVGLEITMRKKAQEALRENEERYRTIVSSMSDIIFVIDGDDRFREVHCKRDAPLFMEPGAFLSKKLDEVLPPAVGKAYQQSAAEVRKTGASRRYEYPLEINRERKWFEANLDLHVDGTSIVASVRDVTDRRQTAAALRESEEKYRGLIENAHDAIYIARSDGTFEYVNPAFEKLTDYTAEEIHAPAFNFWNIIHPDDVAVIEERKQARQRGEEVPERYRFRIVAKNGEVKALEVTTVNIGKAKNIRVMGILRDETAKIAAEQAMARALQEERQFKLATAHYFFNPICIAKGFLEMAAEEPDNRKHIGKALDAIDRIETVVKNVTQRGEITE